MKVIKVLFYLLLIFCYLSSTNAQNISQVTGTVINSNNEVAVGNIILLSVPDSSFIFGTSFFGEAFQIENIDKPQVILKLTSLQFDDVFINVNYDGQPNIDLGEIVVENSSLLNEVLVTDQKSIYKQKTDGTLEILIENTSLATSNSVSEILSKSPEVIVDEEGGVTIFGKGNAIIYLNGKRVPVSQVSTISPSNIKTIEIIRNPSSKYDAEGAAVINVTTIKNANDGYKANLKQNFSYADFAGNNSLSSINLNFNRKRFAYQGFYSLQLGNDRRTLETTRNRDEEDIFLKSDLSTDWLESLQNTSNFGFGVQYNTDNGSYASFEYSGSFEKLGGNTISNNKIITTDTTDYLSDINVDEINTSNLISLNYSIPMDTSGSSLFFGGQYSNFKTKTDNFIDEQSVGSNMRSSRDIKNILDLDIYIVTGQVDYKKVFKNKNYFEIGTKFSNVDNSSDLAFQVYNDEVFVTDNNLSNSFSYDELIGALYFNYSGSFSGNTKYSIGLRSEVTDYQLDVSPDSEIIEDRYFNLFPNLSVYKKFNDDFSLNFSMSSRIRRPAYNLLNPVLIYQDPFTSIQGNPSLKPENINAFELTANIKKIIAKVGYNYVDNAIGSAALRGETPNSYVLKRLNWDVKHEIFTSISRKFNVKWWTSVNTVFIQYTNKIAPDLDFEIVTPKPNLYFYTNNRFNVMDVFNFEVLFWYMGKEFEGVFEREKRYNLAFSVDKTFFNNSLRCQFTANDVLKSIRTAGNYTVGQTNIYYNNRWNTDYFRLSAIYNFGKLKKISYKNRSIGKSENNRAK